jgi:hypothetical protein
MSRRKIKFMGGVFPALLLFILIAVCAHASMFRLERSKIFYAEVPPIRSVIPDLAGSWMSIGDGYVYAKSHDLCYYSQDLRLLKQMRISDTTPYGATQYVVVDDSILYVLDCGRYIESFDRNGNSLGRRFLPKGLTVDGMAFWGSKIMLSGSEVRQDERIPELMIIDTLNPDADVKIVNLLPATVLKAITSKKNGDFINLSVSSFKDGFIATSDAGPEVYFFSPDGKLKDVIKTPPPGYRYLKDAPELDRERSFTDQAYFREWQASFDNAGESSVIDDTLLVVSGRSFLDIYDINNMSFLERIEISEQGAGFPRSIAFVRDSSGRTYLKVSEYRLAAETTSADSLSKSEETNSTGDSCRTCGRPITPYAFVETQGAKTADSLGVGRGRYALVYDNSSFEPESLAQFCIAGKKTMFIFCHPADFRTELLLDTTLYVLKDRKDWQTIVVLCYPEPDELKLYLAGLPGDRILINRNQAVPEKTLALGDLALTPLLVACGEGGGIIGGFALGPRYDGQKINNGDGITFETFLRQCGIAK